MRKRGQTEILGILVVVFIMSIGLFYVVGLKLSQRNPNTFNLYQDTELAHATILALLNSEIHGCMYGTLEDNIKKLGSGSSCDETNFKNGIEAILDATIGEGGLNRIYAYEIYTCPHTHDPLDSCVQAAGPIGFDLDTTDVYQCLHQNYDASSNVQPVETTTGRTYNFKLVICRT